MSSFLNRNNKFLIFDTETEGLNLVHSRPWEFSYSVLEDNQIVHSEQRFIWWDDLKVGAEAAKVTRFDKKKYKELAEPPEVVYNDIIKFFEGDHFIVTQNGLGFDAYMLKVWWEAIGKWKGFQPWIKKMIDTNPIFKAYQKGIRFSDEEFLLNQYGWLNVREKGLKSNLTFMCKYFNIPVDETRTHEGLYDIHLTGECLKKLIYNYQES